MFGWWDIADVNQEEGKIWRTPCHCHQNQQFRKTSPYHSFAWASIPFCVVFLAVKRSRSIASWPAPTCLGAVTTYPPSAATGMIRWVSKCACILVHPVRVGSVQQNVLMLSGWARMHLGICRPRWGNVSFAPSKVCGKNVLHIWHVCCVLEY
jgi:hypothetical protein